MAIKDGDFNGADSFSSSEIVLPEEARAVFKNVLQAMVEEPDDLAKSIDASVEIYANGINEQIVPPILTVTAIRASSLFLENFISKPLTEAARESDPPSDVVLRDLSKGVYHMAQALAEADGAMVVGAPQQAINSLVSEAIGMTVSERAAFISKNLALRKFLVSRRMDLLKEDGTGRGLVLRERDDLERLSKGISPYEGYRISRKPINAISLEGAVFVSDAFEIIYRQARETVGDGRTIRQ